MGSGPIRLALAAYEAALVLTNPHTGHPSVPTPTSPRRETDLLQWHFEGPDGAADVTVPHRADVPAQFTGSVSYTTTVAWEGDAILVLDPSGLPVAFPPPTQPQSFQARTALPFTLVAQVFVNEEPAGVLWDPPFVLDISRHLIDGDNTIRLVITGTSVPAMRAVQWQRIFEEAIGRFGRRFAMQDMDQVDTHLPVGLFVVPRLRSGS